MKLHIRHRSSMGIYDRKYPRYSNIKKFLKGFLFFLFIFEYYMIWNKFPRWSSVLQHFMGWQRQLFSFRSPKYNHVHNLFEYLMKSSSSHFNIEYFILGNEHKNIKRWGEVWKILNAIWTVAYHDFEEFSFKIHYRIQQLDGITCQFKLTICQDAFSSATFIQCLIRRLCGYDFTEVVTHIAIANSKEERKSEHHIYHHNINFNDFSEKRQKYIAGATSIHVWNIVITSTQCVHGCQGKIKLRKFQFHL